MPTYEYQCQNCDTETEASKPVAEYNTEEKCPNCSCVMAKKFSGRIGLHNTAVQEKYFSHTLGKVVNGPIHEKKLAKEKGMIELGNERPEKHLKPKRQEYEI